MTRLLLYANTLRHLRVSQLSALIRKRLLLASSRVSHVGELRTRPGVGISSCLSQPNPSEKPYTFSFLNREKTFPDGHVDWVSSDMPKLWRYNLHYFDYLSAEGRNWHEKAALISDWIARNLPGTPDAWEPYTLSLRMVNWIKFFIAPEVTPQKGWLQSLYAQALWLERNIEDHLLANHYLKNGVALFFAGLYFEGTDADRWLATGRHLLAQELDEQFLPDGGHFERSPMYHAISVTDYLDVLNLMAGSKRAMRFEEEPHFIARAHDALTFLADLCLPDGDVPLFNDAAFGIAPPPAAILAYGSRVAGYTRPSSSDTFTITEKPHTGYYVIRDRSDMMVIDCGAGGPEYQPGHTHADTLSYELALNGHRIIVDSGVYDYEPGPRRTYARSTRAHNTLCIDHQDQFEIWGVFRVARRAYPLRGHLARDGARHARFEGAHNGYARLPGRLIHSRVIDYLSSGKWTIHDRVEGRGTHTIESCVHVHPDYRLTLVGPAAEIRDNRGNLTLTILPESNVDSTIEGGWYFPEFGRERSKSTLVMTYRGPVPITLAYQMIKTVPSQLGLSGSP